MARDFEDTFNPDNLSELELRTLVRQELLSHDGVDADNITVTTEQGVLVLSGRVGTEGERRIAEHIITDVIGLTRYRNVIVVDPIRRDEEPEDIEEHAGMTADSDGEPLGRGLDQEDDTAEHLEEDLDARLYGTHDLQSAIERGTPWVPPDAPTQEGFSGTEDGDQGAMREDH
jgi:hypothetical protein